MEIMVCIMGFWKRAAKKKDLEGKGKNQIYEQWNDGITATCIWGEGCFGTKVKLRDS